MLRLLIFVLLGPPLGMLCWLSSTEMLPPPDFHSLMRGMPTVYLIGTLPAVALGCIDWVLDAWQFPYRVAIMTVGGAAIGVALFQSVFPGFLLGAVPAAVCSWLSSGRKRAA